MLTQLIKYKLALAALIVGGLFIALRAPAVQNTFLRSFVGSRVSMVTRGGGGGSGFLLEAPSGKNVVITNSHVCDAEKGATISVDGVPSKILKRDKKRDLCAIAATEESSSFGLTLRDDGPSKGELIYVVGHPRLDPQTVTSGEYVGSTEIGVAHFGADSEEECAAAGLDSVSMLFGYLCFSRHIAGITTVSILGGNSGSLVVDYRGRVLGVMFAANSTDNRGFMIRYEDLRFFVGDL